jgi:predicted PurR-regulated permease PerM
LIPPFIDQTNEFVDDVPAIVDDLEGYYADLIGEDPGEVGDRVEEFVQNWTDEPERFIGPITSIGLDVAGIVAAFLLMVITAYYMAVRPGPLVDGLVSSRRRHDASTFATSSTAFGPPGSAGCRASPGTCSSPGFSCSSPSR